jgi:membrane protein required for colicin V production
LQVNWVDLLALFVVAASATFGVWRGLVKEALSVATWLAAIWFAWRFAFVVEPMLGEWSSAPELKIWAARAITFVIIMVIGGLIAWLARSLVRHTGLSGMDRLLGGAFGVFRGILIIGLLVIGLQLSGLDQDPWWQQAWLRPYGERIAAGIRYYAELGGRYLESQELV